MRADPQSLKNILLNDGSNEIPASTGTRFFQIGTSQLCATYMHGPSLPTDQAHNSL